MGSFFLLTRKHLGFLVPTKKLSITEFSTMVYIWLKHSVWFQHQQVVLFAICFECPVLNDYDFMVTSQNYGFTKCFIPVQTNLHQRCTCPFLIFFKETAGKSPTAYNYILKEKVHFTSLHFAKSPFNTLYKTRSVYTLRRFWWCRSHLWFLPYWQPYHRVLLMRIQFKDVDIHIIDLFLNPSPPPPPLLLSTFSLFFSSSSLLSFGSMSTKTNDLTANTAKLPWVQSSSTKPP